MAKEETKRISPATLAEDDKSFQALQGVTGYNPANPDFALAKITAAHAELVTAKTEETQAEAAAKAARDKVTAKQWAYHNLVLGSKSQVAAQFGESSDQVQAVGRKKKTEYARPVRKPKTPKTG